MRDQELGSLRIASLFSRVRARSALCVRVNEKNVPVSDNEREENGRCFISVRMPVQAFLSIFIEKVQTGNGVSFSQHARKDGQQAVAQCMRGVSSI
jgi:hypothetical protein